MKKAFTLVELLVVVAIIGILAAVLLGTFSGGSESAQTARCLTNLRNLAAACQSYGVAAGHYPLAGSIETVQLTTDRGTVQKLYKEVPGWISWNSDGAYAKGNVRSHRSNSNVAMYETSEEIRLYAVTNGCLWKYMNSSLPVYQCPQHVRKQKKLNPMWSYVMNAFFKWDTTNGRGSFPADDYGAYEYGRLKNADRRLLLAEIQFVEDSKRLKAAADVPTDTSGQATDAILQYPGCRGGGDEAIGFNHKSGKNFCANVVFADGHTEKLLYPKEGDQAEIKNLTKWLCEGTDVTFDGKHYEEMK